MSDNGNRTASVPTCVYAFMTVTRLMHDYFFAKLDDGREIFASYRSGRQVTGMNNTFNFVEDPKTFPKAPREGARLYGRLVQEPDKSRLTAERWAYGNPAKLVLAEIDYAPLFKLERNRRYSNGHETKKLEAFRDYTLDEVLTEFPLDADPVSNDLVSNVNDWSLSSDGGATYKPCGDPRMRHALKALESLSTSKASEKQPKKVAVS